MKDQQRSVRTAPISVPMRFALSSTRAALLSRRRGAVSLAVAAASAMVSPARGTVIDEYQFTNQSTGGAHPPTTLAANLTGSSFTYVNANPSQPPLNNPPFIVQGGTLPDDPPYFIGQGDWFPHAQISDDNYYTFSVTPNPGFAINVDSFSFLANSRQMVTFLTQVQYSTSPSFSNPVSFDTTPFTIPTQQVWNTFTASDAPITQGTGTYYFRIYAGIDPNGNGTISDLINMGNITLNGSLGPAPGPTSLYWDPGKIGAMGSGGSGTWLGSSTWSNGATEFPWSNTTAETANFGGASGGAVALGGSVSALNGINFTTAGYVISGVPGQQLQVGGTINTAADATISASLSATGTAFTKSGPATLTLAGPASFGAGTALSVISGTLVITTGSATFAMGSPAVIAANVGDVATLTVNGTGSFFCDNALILGNQGGAAIFNIADSASVNVASLIVANGSTGASATATVNQSGGIVSVPSVVLGGLNSASAATYNLTGGTLATTAVLPSNTGGATTFNFNGGTLKMTGDNSTLFNGIAQLLVGNGGAIIDTNGHTITLANPLTPSAGSTGGLTKNGNGTLTLNIPSSLTGATNINGGTLTAVSQNGGVGIFSGGSNVNVNSGGTLQLNGIDSLGFFAGSAVLNINGGLATTDGSTSHSNLGIVNFTGGVLTAVGNGDSYGNYILGDTINSSAAATTATLSAHSISIRNEVGHVGGTFNIARGSANVDLLVSSVLTNITGETAGLKKLGNGILELTAQNTFTGPTTVAAGTLDVETYALPSTSVVISSGATLQYDFATRTFLAGTLSGAGTLRKIGAGDMVFGGPASLSISFSAGAVIDVEAGTLYGTSSFQGGWAGNLASVNIASSAIFDAVEGGPSGTLQFDALTGGGRFQGGYFGAFNAMTVATIGVAGTSGTFGGTIADDSGARLAIIKTGLGTQVFAGTSTYTGGTTITGGTLGIGASSALPGGGKIVVGNGQSAAALQLGHSIGTVTLSTSALTINSKATVDVNNDTLVLNYTGATPVSTIRSLLISGFNGGNWNGSGIDSSAAGGDASFHTALGYKDTGSSIIVKYTYYGDNNLDGKVDASDFQMLLDGLVSTNASSWSQGDYTYDGRVDLGNDFNLFLAGYLAQGNALGDLAPIVLADAELSNSQRQQLLGIVPEPDSLALIGAISSLTFVARRTRRS
jgi:autotransporter-associated beta strand protein